ncbi:EGF-like domain-containing protein 2 [Gigantopelta aegis]|uniref:EGF-like domain-containing protein 2 n=1 Tax=Gigantopelta aegis TaxID=1735272 RepID=UPI001B88886A|nr:EGF-like domain-containing protein 2 [Gigantopelta aegis]
MTGPPSLKTNFQYARHPLAATIISAIRLFRPPSKITSHAIVLNYQTDPPAPDLKDADPPCTAGADVCGPQGKSICSKTSTTDSTLVCTCSPGWGAESRTDPKCTAGRYKVACFGDKMIININPYGTFSGRIYLWNKPACTIADSIDTSNSEHDEFIGGKVREIQYTGDTTCGDVTSTNQNDIKDFKVDVFVGYSPIYTNWRDEIVTVTCKLDQANNVITSNIESNNIDTTQLKSTDAKNDISVVTIEVKVDGNVLTSGQKVNMGQMLSFTLTAISGIGAILLYDVKIDNGKESTDGQYQFMQEFITDIRYWEHLPSDFGGRNKVRFEFKTFVFTETAILKVTFTVRACDSVSESLCSPIDCNGETSSGRRKRLANDVTNQTHVLDRIFVIDYPEDTETAEVTKTDARDKEQECETSPLMIGTVAALAGVVVLLLVLLLVFIKRSFRREQKK